MHSRCGIYANGERTHQGDKPAAVCRADLMPPLSNQKNVGYFQRPKARHPGFARRQRLKNPPRFQSRWLLKTPGHGDRTIQDEPIQNRRPSLIILRMAPFSKECFSRKFLSSLMVWLGSGLSAKS